MRSSKSRSRGNKNRNNRPSGGNIVNRVFDSSGPDGKVRGTPQQIIEKYNQLHRDAQLSGDRVAAENFAQHAEHYLRMLAEAQREIEQKREEAEQANRERQAERDRERAARLKAQEDAAGAPAHQQHSEGHDDRGQDRGQSRPQPEAEREDSGLVATPENRSDEIPASEGSKPAEAAEGEGGEAAKPKRARKPRVKRDLPEGEKPAPRARRKKEAEPKGDGQEAGSAEAAE
ncbi:DUF4167 domain-containing protein [Limimaricola pyoseonensis]|uniref:DUF4167 domain-containing protein n=1 Tax=Limimaricola pyoseonensis TaxID=521013 RepID=A0A1G7ASM9_9RHOB|nr:DUF4167 domain-containing protein [Limimaricola pyoseonensis]SDE16995.1 protein of unknown function [Limimaricola pyoseonensis]